MADLTALPTLPSFARVLTPRDPAAVDQIISANRAATPASVADQRAVKRLSIAELNDLDQERLIARLRATREDDRSVVTRVLDLIDLPRNAMMNLATSALSPETRQQAMESGESGALGLPRIHASDVLRSLGVRNRLITGLVGFAGDVALDPLTYVGPAGWGLKVAGATGRTATVGARGARALKRGIESAAEGRLVGSAEVRSLLDAAGFTVERVMDMGRTLDPKAIVGEIRAGVLGVRPPESIIGQAGRAVGSVLGFDATFKRQGDTILGRHLDDGRWLSIDPSLAPAEMAQAVAARNFYRRYGKAAAGSLTEVGIRLGRGGSQILHVPFTEIGVAVPAFSRAGRHAETLQTIAHAPALATTPALTGAARAIRAGLTAVNEVSTDYMRVAEDVFRLEEEAVNPAVRGGRSDPSALGRAKSQLSDLGKQHAEGLAALEARMRELSPSDIKTPTDAAELMYQIKLVDLARTEALDVANMARALLPENLGYARAIREAVGKRVGEFEQRVLAGDVDALGNAAGPSAGSLLRDEVKAALASGAPLSDDLLQRVRNHARNIEIGKADEAVRSWLTLSDAAFNAKSDAIPAMLSAEADLIQRYAQHLQAPIQEVAEARGADSLGLVALGKFLLQTDDSTIAVTPFGTVAQALDQHKRAPWVAETAREVDRFMRHTFGYRTGVMHELSRRVIRSASMAGQREVVRRGVQHVSSDLFKIMRDSGIPDAKISDISKLHMARMIVLRQEGSAYFGTALRRVNGVLVEVEHPAVTATRKAKEELGAEFITKLDGVAQTHLQMLDRLGQEALADGLIAGTVRGNIPNRIGLDGRARIARSKRSKFLDGSKRSGDGGGAPMREEAFQVGRTTTQYRFRDSQGNLRRFFEYESAQVRNLTEGDLSLMSPDHRARIEGIRETMAEWDLLQKREAISEAEAMVRYGRDTDPLELNQLVGDGALSTLLDGPMERAFLDDGVMALAVRLGEQHVAYARRDFHMRVKQHGLLAHQITVNEQTPGGTLKFAGGKEGRIIVGQSRDGKPQHVVLIGGTRYRKLNEAVIEAGDFGLLNGSDDTDAMARLYPVEVADMIEGVHGMIAAPRVRNAFLNAVEEAQKLFKQQALFHPSWTISNLIGSMALLTQAGANLPSLMRNLPGAFRTMMAVGRPEVVSAVRFNIKGKEFSGADMLRLMEEHYVSGGLFGLLPHEVKVGRDQVLASDAMSPHGLAGTVLHPRQAVGKVKARYQEMVAMRLQRLAEQATARDLSESATLSTLARGKALLQATVNPAVATWFKANQKLEDSLRLAAMAAWMEDGLEPVAAAAEVRRACFDYFDFTSQENAVRTYLLPFASWMRNNLAFQMKQFLIAPSQAAATPKIVEALEELAAGENQVPIHLRPRWIADQIAVQMSDNPTARWSFGLANTLPSAEFAANWAPALAGGLEGIQHTGRQIVSGLNPLLKAPVELAVGTEFFTGRSIAADSTRGDVSVPEHLAGQIRIARELGVLSDQSGPLVRAGDQGPGVLAGRAALGGRFQDFSEDRLRASKLGEYREREDQLRGSIFRAESEGDDSLRYRANLLHLYYSMMRDGFAESVPAWAKDWIGVHVEGGDGAPVEAAMHHGP